MKEMLEDLTSGDKCANGHVAILSDITQPIIVEDSQEELHHPSLPEHPAFQTPGVQSSCHPALRLYTSFLDSFPKPNHC